MSVNSNSPTPVEPVKTAKSKRLSTKVICYTAVLTALSVACNILTFVVGVGGSLAISFTYLPNFIAGAFLGPIPGLITGLCGDLLGCWIAPKGDFNPIILVASGLLGFIPGVVFRLFKGKSEEVKRPLLATIVSMVSVLCICSVLNTFGMYLFYFKGAGRTLGAVFALRMPKQILIWAINFCLVLLIRAPMAKLIKV